MRSLFLVTLAAILLTACGTQEVSKPLPTQSWPENNLWMEDGFLNGDVTEDVFNEIINISKELYAPIAEQWKEELVINALWDDSTVNANANRDGKGWTEVNMYGGLARRAEVLPEGFALVLCHELSHLYGGAPYIDVPRKMSAEGQSDYMGAGWCLRNVAQKMSVKGNFIVTDYMKKKCANGETCIRQLAAGVSLGTLLARMNGEGAPNLETPDNSVVRKTNTSYPKTTQCRLDTYHNGALGLDRPLCWYKP